MTARPPWGTPSSPEPDKPERREPERREPEPGEPRPVVATLGFYAIIEQRTGTGDRAGWRVDPMPFPAGRTRDEARTTARRLARTFRPRHPFTPQGRSVFRVDDDTYVVLVAGMTRTFHFRITVAELVS